MNTESTIVKGRAQIKKAYRVHERVAHYIESRYEADTFGRRVHEGQARHLKRSINRLKPDQLLEIACGPARLTVHVPPVRRAVALDQSPAMLALAAERLKEALNPTWELVGGDAFDLPFAVNEFDTVLSFKLLRHFDRSNRHALLAQVRRVLRPGGYFMVDVPHRPAYEWLLKKWGVAGSWIEDCWFSIAEVERELKQSGFRLVEAHPVMANVKLQYYLFSHMQRSLSGVGDALCRANNVLPFGQPYEWLVTCRCE